MMFCTQVA